MKPLIKYIIIIILLFSSCRSITPADDQLIIGAYIKGSTITGTVRPLNMVLISAKKQTDDTTFIIQSIYSDKDGSFQFELVGLVPVGPIPAGASFEEPVLMEFRKPGFKGISREYKIHFVSGDFMWSQRDQNKLDSLQWKTTDLGIIKLDSISTGNSK